MQYRPLGRSGIHVSPYALGTMNFGAMANNDHDAATAIIHRALDAGINLIDTADVYSLGESEQIVGKAIKGRRDDVVLATKFSNPMGQAPNQRGASRRWITTAVENSLRRLETDYIDLYQYHYPDDSTDMEETLSALTDLVRSGKVRAIGTSKQPAAGIVEAHWISERKGFERFRCEQPHYSILNRGIERDVLPTAQRYGMGTIVWSPLAQGLLTGRVRKGQPSTLTRQGHYFEHLRDEHRIDAVEAAHPDRRERRDLADPHGDRLRDRAPRRDRRALRPTHHRSAQRPARRRRGDPDRRRPRPDRRDRPARYRRRPAPNGLRPLRPHHAAPAPRPVGERTAA